MRLITVILIIVICYSCNTNHDNDKSKYNNYTSKIDSIISVSDFNGTVAIAKDTSIFYTNTIGFSDFENEQKLNVNDLFVIGSISKQITAVLILRAYEKGIIQLDDKIGKYLSKIKQPWVKDISIHQLLIHTHGIIELDKPLEFKPGTQFQYSQIGYDLLAQILESVTNQPFEQHSMELFDLYNLKNTFHPKSNLYKNLVKGYVEENGNLEYSPHSLYNYPAAGSFISNVTDLIRWNYLLHSHQLVKKQTLELMKTSYTTRNHPIFETVEYGYGLLFKKGENNIEIGALGYAPGFVSACYYYPKSQISLVILENTARNLDDFRSTFKVHLQLMEIMKNE